MSRIPQDHSLLAAAILAGAVLGVTGARIVLVGSGWSLVPWAAVAVLIGAVASSKTGVLLCGTIFGFVVAFSFMLAGYEGLESVLTRAPLFGALGIVGATCAVPLAFAGHWLRRRFASGS